MSISKHLTSNTPFNIDSFETNLHQIEQTDKLLSNLELKLAKLFSKSAVSPKNFDNNLKNKSPSNFSNSQQRVSPRYDPNESPNHLQESLMANSEQNFYQNDNNNNGKIIDSSRYSDFKPSVPQFSTFPEQTEGAYDYPYNPHSSQENLDIIDLNESRKNPIDYNKENFRGNSLETFGNEAINFGKRDLKDSFSRKNLREESSKNIGGDLLDKMGRVEAFYKNKIHILEEKLVNTEEDVNEKSKTIDELKQENEKLKQIIKENKKREDDYKDSEYQWTKREKELNEEKRKMEESFEGMKKMFKNILNEKEDLETKYEGLMNVHRQIIQIDLEKNKKFLESSLREKEHTAKRDEAVESLKLSVQKYKEELDYLKENNYLIRKQYLFEIDGLKTELSEQRRINQRLQESLSLNENTGRRFAHKRDNFANSLSYMHSGSVYNYRDGEQIQEETGVENLIPKERRNKSICYENTNRIIE